MASDVGRVSVYAEERQQGIAQLLTRAGRLSVVEIAAQYDVTTETVRRDLTALERAGFVRRVHGGAVRAGVLSVLELGVHDRQHAHAAEKNRIAAAALDELPGGGGSIVLDAGTTTGRLAALLPHDRPLTVVTTRYRSRPASPERPTSTCTCCRAGSAGPPRPRSARTPSRPWRRCEPTWSSSAPTG